MSYIHNSCVCENCGEEFRYVWQLPDGIFEKVPKSDEYVIANQNKIYTKYEVSAKCPHCRTILCFEYSLDGKFICKKG